MSKSKDMIADESSELYEIFENLVGVTASSVVASLTTLKPTDEGYGFVNLEREKTTAIRTVKQLVLGLIGEDDKLDIEVGFLARVARNELRAELREKVKQL